MGLSVVGVFVAKKYGSATLPFVAAFIAAPLMGFYQKKEADFNFISEFSKYSEYDLGATLSNFCNATQFYIKVIRRHVRRRMLRSLFTGRESIC